MRQQAFTLGAALRGYEVVGSSRDEANQSKAASRAKLLGLEGGAVSKLRCSKA